MYYLLALLVLFFCPAVFCKADEPLHTYKFSEVWGYVFAGEEKFLKGGEPITDIAYFSAPVNEIGRITKEVSPAKLPEPFRSRCKIHLVISAPSNKSLMHWCLDKDQETRKGLIEDILRLSAPFDGVQIDFEAIRPEDREGYWNFLKDIKNRLPKNKVLSVAVLPRLKDTQDAFNYQQIAQYADKIIVMAYDEHWQSGQPGAIASLGWCGKIHQFASQKLADKLVMGIPLYGRVWQKQQVARSLKYHQTLDLWKQHQTLVKRAQDGTPHFEFQQTVDAFAFFEDIQSLCQKLSFYEKEGVKAIAFWRISQEPAALWTKINVH